MTPIINTTDSAPNPLTAVHLAVSAVQDQSQRPQLHPDRDPLWRGNSVVGVLEYRTSTSTWPRKYGPTSIAKGFSTTSPIRIMALLGDRLGDYLHTNRGKIEISQVFMEI